MKFPILLSLLAALVAAPPSAGQAPAAEAAPVLDDAPRHVRVIWTTEPQARAVVSWSTQAPAANHVVVLAREAGVLADDELLDPRREDSGLRRVVAERNAAFSRRKDSDVAGWYYHHAEITGLKPSTRYHFRVQSDAARSRVFHFTTAPAEDRPFALLSGGDSRSDPATRRDMNRRARALAKDEPAILALAHGGDYVANGTDLGQWLQWLADHEESNGEDGLLLPVIPARGNHEGRGALYDEVWCWPGGEDAVNWFATQLSPQVLLVTLNSETAAGGDQQAFLQRSLEAHRGTRWQVVQYHRPLFPAVKTPGRAKSHWQPLFDEFRIDLALESDGHVLKRTVPLLGDAPAADGVVYVGEGGLGVPQRTPQDGRWYLEAPGMAVSAHHLWVVHFGANEMRMLAVGRDGEVLDRSSRPARQR